jgi:hypothetical protein
MALCPAETRGQPTKIEDVWTLMCSGETRKRVAGGSPSLDSVQISDLGILFFLTAYRRFFFRPNISITLLQRSTSVVRIAPSWPALPTKGMVPSWRTII